MKNSTSANHNNHLQLLRDEEVFTSILENLNSGVALIDSEGRFVSYNKKFLSLFGLSEESSIKNVNDQNWADWQVFGEDMEVLHVDDHPVRRAALTGKTVSNQLVGVRLPSGGDIIWMLISAEPLFNEKGEIKTTICTYLDVTEHKLADAALRRSIIRQKADEKALIENQKRLQELNATKDKLFSIISHDLKSPFSGIIGFSELLIEKLEKGDTRSASDYARVILDSSWQAISLITNLIEWSRMQTGRLSFSPSPLDLVSVINEVTGLLYATARQKSIDISVQISKSPDELVVPADKAMIATVLRNLLSNAIKFSHPGGKVKIAASRKDNVVTIQVIDKGIGMDDELVERLFKSDQNVSTPGTKYESGTGLGILISKEFIAKHGGEICVKSRKGKGSTFVFTLVANLLTSSAIVRQ